MSKIIIDNRTDIDDIFCIGLAQSVMRGGRMSNGEYCPITVFTLDTYNRTVCVYSFMNAKSDRFVVWEYPE